MVDDEIDDDILETQDEVEVQTEEAEVEAEKDEASEGEQEQPQRRGRAADTISDLRRERRAERERADDLERQLAKLRDEFTQSQRHLDQRAQEERMANMTPEERIYAELQDNKRQLAELQSRQERELKNARDRLSFESLAGQSPSLKKIAPQVEQEYEALQRQFGVPVPRELIAAALIGLPQLRALKDGGVAKAQAAAKRNIERQRTSPGGGGSDVRRGGSKVDPNSPEARKARLEGVSF
jgi:hypothetical protein